VALERQAEHQLLHSVLGEVTLSLYQHGRDQAVVLRYGNPSRRSHTLVRIQSACTYGDTLLAVDCDCRDQLDDTFRHFLDRGSGILIYFPLDDSGALLTAKARAYEQQERGGTEAVEEFGRAMSPQHDFTLAIEVLMDLDIRRVALLTNNMRKVDGLRAGGLDVAREELRIRVTETNFSYLRAKQAYQGHELNLAIGHDGGPPRRRCFVIGSAVMDHVFEMGDDPSVGETRQALDYRRRPGGKALSQAIALSRLGADVSLLTVRGHDEDGDAIAGVLTSEGVRAYYTGVPGGGGSPQTAVFQPGTGGPATYVGWLGPQHRTLRQRPIDERATEIGACDAVLITLEASADAVRRSINHARPDALVILTASPMAEFPYTLSTDTLEDVNVLIGSPYELHALLPHEQLPEPRGPVGARDVAWALAEQCGITVVATNFRSVERWVLAVNPDLDEPVLVRFPRIREMDPFAASVGMTDVFCAAFALAALELDVARRVPRAGVWRADPSPFALGTNLLDVLVSALGPAAWVARSNGGYDSFPRQGPALEEWCRRHPPVRVDLAATGTDPPGPG